MIGGGVLLEVLSYTALKNESYAYACNYAACAYAYETSTNKPIMFAGLGIAAGGIVLEAIGRHKNSIARQLPSISFGPRRFAVSKTVKVGQ